MADPLYLLMMEVGSADASGVRAFVPARVDDRVMVEREVAERIAQRSSPGRRFLLLASDTVGSLTAAGEQFGSSERRGIMAMLPGETFWSYGGEPLRVEMMQVLLTVMDGAESPDPDVVLLPVAAIVDVARSRFDDTEAHELETTFDALVMDLGGSRAGEPPAYRVSISRLFGLA